MKLERIVVGIDFSSASLDAARWTSRQFAREAEIVLVHAISLPGISGQPGQRDARHKLVLDTMHEGADKRLRELSTSLPAERIWLEIREEEPHRALAVVATDYSADLIVVGAHGERAGTLEGPGTTAQSILRMADVPVCLVSRPREMPIDRILVAVNDAPATRQALRYAAALSDRFNARITTLHVAPSGVIGHVLTAAAGTDASITPTRERNVPDPWIELAVKAGVPRDRVTSEATFGEPAKEIVAAADRLGVDLVVMGRRVSGGLRRAILGSVTAAVLRDAGCSVVVVPEPG